MNLLNTNEHFDCFNYDNQILPMIEIKRLKIGDSGELKLSNNELVFVLEGRLKYFVSGFSEKNLEQGQFLFHAAGSHLLFTVLIDAVIMIFRPQKIVRLCDNYRIENLYRTAISTENDQADSTLVLLDINSRLWHFIIGLKDCISDGLSCKTFFELKISELFIFFRAYYSKKQLQEFLHPILTPDIAFSEMVRYLCADKFYTVEELSSEMNLSSRQFTKRFKRVFNTTPYQWIKKRKVDSVRRELITTDKPIKEIAADHGFGSLGQFTNFCKDEMGKTPSSFRK